MQSRGRYFLACSAGLVALVGGCGRWNFDPLTDDGSLGPDDGRRRDGLIDDGVRDDGTAEMTFGVPVLVPIGGAEDPSLTGDQLELYVIYLDNQNREAIHRATRTSTTQEWSLPTLVDELRVNGNPTTAPEVSRDGLTMYMIRFSTNEEDVFVSTRPTRSALWAAPTRVGELSTLEPDLAVEIADSGLEAYICVGLTTSTSYEVRKSSRATTSSPWSTPVAVPSINSSTINCPLEVVGDTLYLSSDRPGSAKRDLWTMPVAGTSSDAVPISPLNSSEDETAPWVSPDQRTIYFTSTRGGLQSLLVATRR